VAVCQNLVPLVNIKIAGKWMFIPLKMVSIGIDPYPCMYIHTPSCWWSPAVQCFNSIPVQRTPFVHQNHHISGTVKSAKSLYCWPDLSEARVNPRYFWTAPFPSHHSLVKIRSIILNHSQSLFWLVSYLFLSHVVYKYIYVHIHIFIYIVYHVIILSFVYIYV